MKHRIYGIVGLVIFLSAFWLGRPLNTVTAIGCVVILLFMVWGDVMKHEDEKSWERLFDRLEKCENDIKALNTTERWTRRKQGVIR